MYSLSNQETTWTDFENYENVHVYIEAKNQLINKMQSNHDILNHRIKAKIRLLEKIRGEEWIANLDNIEKIKELEYELNKTNKKNS